MAFTKILVPTDGSEFTKAAIRQAVELAKVTGGSITALYVIDQTVFGNVPIDSSVNAIYDMMDKEGHNATAFVKSLGEENGIDVSEIVVSGSPVKAIVEASKDFELIVMGTLGRTGFAKFMMGSVAEKVVRFAKCPVMVVKSSEAETK
ncbi:MAG: universal stress protein [Thermoplasmata archaeon]|nr:universal stress protein [Thermoplasmata archaeon]